MECDLLRLLLNRPPKLPFQYFEAVFEVLLVVAYCFVSLSAKDI